MSTTWGKVIAQSVKSQQDLQKLEGKGPLEIAMNKMTDQVNFMGKNMSLMNFAGEVIEEVEFLAGETKDIKHGLGIIPKYRIILRQEGNGVISDIPSSWDKYSIRLKNNGAGPVTCTIWLMRE